MTYKCTVVGIETREIKHKNGTEVVTLLIGDCQNQTDEEVDLEDMEAVNESLEKRDMRLIGNHICDEHAEGVEV